MTTHIIAWIVVLAIGILTVLITEIVVRVPVRNCPNCAWHTPGQCKHPTAAQVPELVEIQMGMWRCPWRELANGKPDLIMSDGGSEHEHSGLNRSHSSDAYVALGRVVGPESNGPIPTASETSTTGRRKNMTKEPPSDLNALVAEAVADLEDGLLWGGGVCEEEPEDPLDCRRCGMRGCGWVVH